MGNVLIFTPRLKPVAPEILEPLAGAALRASLEEAAQTALDAADRIIAVLDRIDGDADLEGGGDDEPSLAEPERDQGSQVVWIRGSDRDCQAEAPETAPSEMAAELVSAPVVLPWSGQGNVIAATGTVLLGLLDRA